MHIDLHDDDRAYIELLLPHYATVQLPRWGAANNYTKGIALFVDAWNPPGENEIQNRKVTAFNGEANWVTPWARNAAKENHRADAELALLGKVIWYEYLTEASEGTLYMLLSKGPCPSCKSVVSYFFQQRYPNIRIVIWYQAPVHVGMHNQQYGYAENAIVRHGFAVANEAHATRLMPAP